MFIQKLLRIGKVAILVYADPKRSRVINLIGKIKKEKDMLLSDSEAYQVFMVVERTQKVKGDIAEVGVYRGGSAKLICEAKKDKSLHLFDTFEGLPNVDEIDAPQFHVGEYPASLDGVKNFLSGYKNVYFYKGVFPATAEPIKNKNFSFVHLDADIYKSTLNCLKFFYPRMTRGGIIISHDYISSSGVRKAFDEFFQNKPEPIIEAAVSQCLVVKL